MYRGEHSIRFYPLAAEKKPDGLPDRKNDVGVGYIGGCAFDDLYNIEGWPDTWRTWRLIPTEKVIFTPPKAKESWLEIPGRHGAVDVNRYTYDHPVFGNRTGSVEFVVDPDYQGRRTDLHSRIARFLQGRDVLAVLRDDRAYYYKGRFTVSDIKPEEYGDTITLGYDLEPFKYDRWYGRETGGRLDGDLTVTLTGREYIIALGSEELTLPDGSVQYPKYGEKLFLLGDQEVVLEGGQDIPDGIGEMNLKGNQIQALRGGQVIVLKNGETVALPEDTQNATVYNPSRIWIAQSTVRAALRRTPFTLRKDTAIELTGEELLDGVISVDGSSAQPVASQTAVLRGGQTLHPWTEQTLDLASGQTFDLTGGQTVANFGSDYHEITLTVPADWGAWDALVSAEDDNDDYLADDFDPQNHVPSGIRTFQLKGTDAPLWMDIPDGCFVTPEFRSLTTGDLQEASMDGGANWHPVGFGNWQASEYIRLGCRRLYLRGTGRIKVRFRGGWL